MSGHCSQCGAPLGPVYRLAGLELDTMRREVRAHGKRVRLRPVDYMILLAMMRRPGMRFSRDYLLAAASSSGTDETLQTYVSRLRSRVLVKTGARIPPCDAGLYWIETT